MKSFKYWMASISAVSLLTVMVVNINISYKPTNDVSLALNNLEALAQGEQGPNDCMGLGNVTCTGGKYYVGAGQ